MVLETLNTSGGVPSTKCGDGGEKGEKEKGSASASVSGGAYGSGGGQGALGGDVGDRGAIGGASGGGEEGEVECEKVPQMSRNRLREIREHAEGECVSVSVFVIILCRWLSLWYLLGHLLSAGQYNVKYPSGGWGIERGRRGEC